MKNKNIFLLALALATSKAYAADPASSVNVSGADNIQTFQLPQAELQPTVPMQIGNIKLLTSIDKVQTHFAAERAGRVTDSQRVRQQEEQTQLASRTPFQVVTATLTTPLYTAGAALYTGALSSAKFMADLFYAPLGFTGAVAATIALTNHTQITKVNLSHAIFGSLAVGSLVSACFLFKPARAERIRIAQLEEDFKNQTVDYKGAAQLIADWAGYLQRADVLNKTVEQLMEQQRTVIAANKEATAEHSRLNTEISAATDELNKVITEVRTTFDDTATLQVTTALTSLLSTGLQLVALEQSTQRSQLRQESRAMVALVPLQTMDQFAQVKSLYVNLAAAAVDSVNRLLQKRIFPSEESNLKHIADQVGNLAKSLNTQGSQTQQLQLQHTPDPVTVHTGRIFQTTL